MGGAKAAGARRRVASSTRTIQFWLPPSSLRGRKTSASGPCRIRRLLGHTERARSSRRVRTTATATARSTTPLAASTTIVRTVRWCSRTLPRRRVRVSVLTKAALGTSRRVLQPSRRVRLFPLRPPTSRIKGIGTARSTMRLDVGTTPVRTVP